MTLSSSLSAGVAGLGVNATKLATISDNIANSGTFGYKRADADFTAVVVGAQAGSYTAGGVVSDATRDISAKGSLATTGNPLDLAILGGGFLPVTSAARVAGGGDVQMQLAPTGSFNRDATGLVRTNSGLALLGWPVDSNGVTVPAPRQSAEGLVPIVVPPSDIAVEPTTEIVFGINLPQVETEATATGAPLSVPIEYFDNFGASRSLTATFTPVIPAAGASNTWSLAIEDNASPAAANPIAEFDLTFSDAGGGLGGTLDTVTVTGGGAFDPATGVATVTTASGPIEISMGPLGGGSLLRQLATDFTPTGVSKNGAGAGLLTGLEVDNQGFVGGTYDTGLTRRLFQVPLVDVPNPDGLAAEDAGAFSVTADSGAFFLWDSADGPVGRLEGFALEESTSDIAGELTSLISTQRAYSSNATVIRTVDEMLQETTNLKR